jgi:hypothetical protein
MPAGRDQRGVVLFLDDAVNVAIVRAQRTRREATLEGPDQFLAPELVDDVLLVRVQAQILRRIERGRERPAAGAGVIEYRQNVPLAKLSPVFQR